jgi:hypothetical protein
MPCWTVPDCDTRSPRRLFTRISVELPNIDARKAAQNDHRSFSIEDNCINTKAQLFDTLVSCGQLQTKTSGPHRAAQVAFPSAPHFSASNYPIQPITSATSSSAVRTLVQVDATITGLRNAFCALALCPRLGNCWSLS